MKHLISRSLFLEISMQRVINSLGRYMTKKNSIERTDIHQMRSISQM